ncbi:uncharacterized protein LOC144860093 [Branchiostoma floridae x Branchiostoma japonicum]
MKVKTHHVRPPATSPHSILGTFTFKMAAPDARMTILFLLLASFSWNVLSSAVDADVVKLRNETTRKHQLFLRYLEDIFQHPSEDCPPDLKYDNSYVEHKTCENLVLQTFRKAVFNAQLVDTIVKKCGTDLRKCFDENADVRAELQAHLKNTRDLYGQYCAKKSCVDFLLKYQKQCSPVAEDMKTIVDEKLLEFTTSVDLSCSDHSDTSGRPCGDLYLQYRLALAASQAKNPETWADFRARINSSVQSGCPMNFPQGWSLRKDMLGCCVNQTINTLIKYQGLWYKQVVQDTLQKCNTSVPADCSTSPKKIKSVYPSGVRFNTVVGIIAASVICVVGMFVFVRAVYTKIRKGEYEREDVRYSEILITDDDDEMGDGEDEEEEVDE